MRRAPSVPTFASYRPRANTSQESVEWSKREHSSSTAPRDEQSSSKFFPNQERARERHAKHRTKRERHHREQRRESDALKTTDDLHSNSNLYVIDRHGDVEAARYGSRGVERPNKTQRKQPFASAQVTERLDTLKRENLDLSTDFIAMDQVHDADTHAEYRDPYQTKTLPASVIDTELPVFALGSPQEASRELHLRVRKNPTDIYAWFELVELQARLLGDAPDTNFDDPRREATLARMELAVIERALGASELNRQSLSLRLAELRILATAGLEPADKLRKRWASFLADSDTSAENTAAKQTAYLEYCRSDTSLRMDDLIQQYVQALEHLRSWAASAPAIVDQVRIEITENLCDMLQRAGMLREKH